MVAHIVDGHRTEFLPALKSLRVRFWFAGLRLRFKVPSLDALARLLEPDLRWPNSNTGEVGRPNKWRGYQGGDRMPRAALLEKVEAVRSPLGSGVGSAAEFRHVLWEILANRTPSPLTVARWMGRLDPRVQEILARAPHVAVDAMFGMGVPTLRAIERERLSHAEPMDALAAWVLAMQQAHRFGLAKLAHSSGCGVVHQLWHLALELHDRGLALSMFELFERWVLPQACVHGKYASMGGLVPQRLGTLIEAVAKRMARDHRTNHVKIRALHLRKVLDRSFFSSQIYLAVDQVVPRSCPDDKSLADTDRKMEERLRELVRRTPERFGRNPADWP